MRYDPLGLHTDSCLDQHERWLLEKEEYEKLWPDHCKQCDGWGYAHFPHNSAPDKVEACTCITGGFCPRCMHESLDEKGENCSNCGWHTNWEEDEWSTPGIRPEPECICLFDLVVDVRPGLGIVL